MHQRVPTDICLEFTYKQQYCCTIYILINVLVPILNTLNAV